MLLDLPQELQVEILSRLDAVSLMFCTMTCRVLNSILKRSSILLYTIQLHFDGLKDSGAPTTKSYSECIEELLRRRQTRLSLDLATHTIHNMKYACDSYELVGDVLASTDCAILELLRLPTFEKHGRTLESISPGRRILAFTMDLAQDVIGMLQEDPNSPTAPANDSCIYLIHIQTLSTNVKHPLAQHGPIRFTVRHNLLNSFYCISMEIMRNTLVLYFWSEALPELMIPGVLVWNWQTSEIILDSADSLTPSLPSPEFEFVLLDPAFCVVTSRYGSGSFRLYGLGDSPAVHLATLHLPPLTEGTEMIKFLGYASPVESAPAAYAPFMINDDDRLHVFTIVYDNSGWDSTVEGGVNLFIHQRIFMRYAFEGASRDVLWDEWGPMNTKMTYPNVIEWDSVTG
ncbi:hypothetical protein BDN70DRAFT_347148 [Pholiota conissans]|uniref:F-box domain-containing protein n=1 Tax=Pholiota conissans TaxID=109636 RepID=A0A9P5YUD4_9AGAR|nr:hypothetical protein BDN70DRAFT_347148 [Pholiota conissans]